MLIDGGRAGKDLQCWEYSVHLGFGESTELLSLHGNTVREDAALPGNGAGSC